VEHENRKLIVEFSSRDEMLDFIDLCEREQGPLDYCVLSTKEYVDPRVGKRKSGGATNTISGPVTGSAIQGQHFDGGIQLGYN